MRYRGILRSSYPHKEHFRNSKNLRLLQGTRKGSVPLSPGEQIIKYESQNMVHYLVSMRSSMFKLLHGKDTNVQN